MNHIRYVKRTHRKDADVAGSFVRPDDLREARQGVREGLLGDVELGAEEDRAVQSALLERIMAHLGFVGLGAMGGRITKRLLDAGYGGHRVQPHGIKGAVVTRAGDTMG